MRSTVWSLFMLIALLTASARTPEIGVEKPSEEIVAGLEAEGTSKDRIFVWDGNAELTVLIYLTDEDSGNPISGATISAVRDRRVKQGRNGRVYRLPRPERTDSGGHAVLKATFPASGSASGISLFVFNSYVTIKAHGHAATRARLSPTYRLDFPSGSKDCKVRLHLRAKKK